MITIWFEAHATTVDNEAKRASGWNDVDLSELGIRQTYEPVERSKERGIEIIFTSDMQRAIKTAIPTAKELGIPVYVSEKLRECNYGDMTLAPSSEIELQRLSRITDPFPNGESFQDCLVRMKKFIDYLKENFDNKTVMVIGHRATQYGLRHYIMGDKIEDLVSEKFEYQPGWKYEL